MKKMTALFLFLSVVCKGYPIEDKSVRWGYKLVYLSNLKTEAIRTLRKTLKAKGVSVLYPTDQHWNLPTGFLSVSSHLDEQEIKSLSPVITTVESAEKTHVLKLKLKAHLSAGEVKKLLALFPNYKIQVRDREEAGGSTTLTVKTTLGKGQIKSIPAFQETFHEIEEES